MTEEAPGESPQERIDATFRNGSVTAVGIILGFSLGFLNQWAANPIAWRLVEIAAAVPIPPRHRAAGHGLRRPAVDPVAAGP